ncbi:MAG TPA: hypothetical protein VG868_13900, partial [Casimicrobiaceae bacterium]|nr:hypothetical protein [Casimicrobiaceae bacterium]
LARRSVRGVNPQELLRSPDAAHRLPAAAVAGVRAALSGSLEWVFVATLPLLAAAVVISLFLRETPLRTDVPGVVAAGEH